MTNARTHTHTPSPKIHKLTLEQGIALARALPRRFDEIFGEGAGNEFLFSEWAKWVTHGECVAVVRSKTAGTCMAMLRVKGNGTKGN